MVTHQSTLWDLAHDGDECAAAFLKYDQNEDLLLQYGESQRWILDFGDFPAGTKNLKKRTFHRGWWEQTGCWHMLQVPSFSPALGSEPTLLAMIHHSV